MWIVNTSFADQTKDEEALTSAFWIIFICPKRQYGLQVLTPRVVHAPAHGYQLRCRSALRKLEHCIEVRCIKPELGIHHVEVVILGLNRYLGSLARHINR